MTAEMDKYLQLEREMRALDEAGNPAAERLRDEMDALWYTLSDAEHAVLDVRGSRSESDVVAAPERNRFSDGLALFATESSALLRVATSPLRISIETPPDFPVERIVCVVDNIAQPKSAGAVEVMEADNGVSVLWNGLPLVTAAARGAEIASFRVDLRPIGIDVHGDERGLHLANRTTGGEPLFDSAAAIVLGGWIGEHEPTGE